MKGEKSIGFIPMDLEEDLVITAKWGGTTVYGVIGFLNAMIDSGVSDQDLIAKPTKNTSFQSERAKEKKIQEIWEKIKKNYKGGLKGNMYYGTINRLVDRAGSDDNILKRFKPFRKYQKDSVDNEPSHESIGVAKYLNIKPDIESHDMIAECFDCGNKFSYQYSKKDKIWRCPKCLSKRPIN